MVMPVNVEKYPWLALLLARDSRLWVLTMIGALVTYLISKKVPPTHWNYEDWLQFLSATVAALAGKLSWSPMDSRRDVHERVGR